MKPLTFEEIFFVHAQQIERYGGATGIRDRAGLEAAIERPFAAFGGQEFYPSPEEKAASILQSIVINHPFVDGNKRVAYEAMRLLLARAGLGLSATPDEKYALVIAVAEGKLDVPAVADWLQERTVPWA